MSLLVRFLEWLAVMVSLVITLASPVLVIWVFSKLRLLPPAFDLLFILILAICMLRLMLDVLFIPVFRAFILRKYP